MKLLYNKPAPLLQFLPFYDITAVFAFPVAGPVTTSPVFNRLAAVSKRLPDTSTTVGLTVQTGCSKYMKYL